MSFAQLCADADSRIQAMCAEAKAIAAILGSPKPQYPSVCLMCGRGYGGRSAELVTNNYGKFKAMCGCEGHGTVCARPISCRRESWCETGAPCGLDPQTHKCYKCRHAQ